MNIIHLLAGSLEKLKVYDNELPRDFSAFTCFFNFICITLKTVFWM